MCSWLYGWLPRFIRDRLEPIQTRVGETVTDETGDQGAEGEDDEDTATADATATALTWTPKMADQIAIRDAAARFAVRFGDHEGVNDATVGGWITQFKS